MASYHKITDVYKRPFHSSMAKALTDGRTPAHVAYDIEHGTKQSRSMFLGTLTHVMLLQPDVLNDKWKCAPTEDKKDGSLGTINKNRNDYKYWKEKTISDGFVPYHIEEQAKAYYMINSLKNTKWVKDILEAPGHPELEVKAIYHDYNLTTSIAIDWLKGSLICDLKKVAAGDPESFGKSIERYGYDLQAWLYLSVMRRVTKSDDLKFIWICVEEKPPHIVSTYFATEEHLAMGEEKCRRAMAIWSECLKNRDFPGYPTTPQEPVMSYYYNRKAAELNY